MKKLFITLAVALAATSAYAFCSHYTIMGPDGRVLFCQKCCGPAGDCQVICT